MAQDSLTITDNRTGRTYEIPIEHGAVRATQLRQIKVAEDDYGLLSYDPGFLNTGACTSRITYIDGERGVLRYRGYPIEQLAESCTFREVAYLIINGELPNASQLERWRHDLTIHTFVHENIKKFIDGFHHDAHPMGIMVSTVAALSTFYPDAKDIFDPAKRRLHIIRLIAKMPTLAAFAYRHAVGLPYVYPDNDLGYPGNFLNMMWRMSELKYHPNPVLERALRVLFILHADHEQNCSTTTVRTAGSSQPDPYTAVAAGVAALYGPLHGGANEAVLKMLREIGSIERIPAYLDRVRRGEVRLMGFGHRMYKNYDPRARIIKQVADEVREELGISSPLLELATELERRALADDYFQSHRLYPNVDFYSGIIYLAMGFPEEMFPVLFALARTPGWCAQWEENLLDPEQKIARPRQVYLGPDERHVVPIAERR